MDFNRPLWCLFLLRCAYGLFLLLWKDGELPVLPLSVYGAVAMAHSDVSEELSSPSQFFFYLYDKRNVSSIQYRPFFPFFLFILKVSTWTYYRISPPNFPIEMLFFSLAWEVCRLRRVNFRFSGMISSKMLSDICENLLCIQQTSDCRCSNGKSCLMMHRYTTIGRDILPQIKTGDIIQSAKLVDGKERLFLPPQENWPSILNSLAILYLIHCCRSFCTKNAAASCKT